MKKAILVILMLVMIATPSLAQEIEHDEIFSLHGTRWEPSENSLILFPFPQLLPFSDVIGFYDGKVVKNDWYYVKKSFYVDLGIANIFSYVFETPYGPGSPRRGSIDIAFGILQPNGIGIMTVYRKKYRRDDPILPIIFIVLLNKTDDDWIPEEKIFDIRPNQGVQGTTLADVWLVTTLYDNHPVEISFNPPDGLTISNIMERINTGITFDLDIAVDAPVGMKRIIVEYDDGNRLLEQDNAFEVLERTN